MIPDIAYERYAPTVIKVDSLKINVRDDVINDDPFFLTDQQSLLVGRHNINNCNLYNLIVDDEGVLINATLSQRTEIGNQYALAVNGDVFVTGQIIAGGSNFKGITYDPNGLFECITTDTIQITPGCLVEVVGVGADNVLQVSLATTAFSSSVFGVCSDVRTTPNVDGTWSLQVQTAGVGVVSCAGPISVGDMITTSGNVGTGAATWINGDIIDTAIHNYTIGKALQSIPDASTQNIRCLFNVVKAPPLGSIQTLAIGGDGMWEMGSNETESIFFPGYVTIGRDYGARSNNYPLNIVRSADRTINHAQINLENTQASRLRVAIVGTSNVSPVVFNTSPATDIEFHAGRQQDYFQRMYTYSNYLSLSSQDSNAWIYATTTSETPNYQSYPSPGDAPHLRIGADGGVGIHTASNPQISYTLRNSNAAITGMYPTVTEQMALHVAGSTYSCNMLIWDYDTQTPQNIDSLYVRRLGRTFPANSIIPGAFAATGSYWFQSNLGVGGASDANYALNVWDDAYFAQDIVVDGTARMSNLICSTAAIFQSDINANADVIVSGSMLLEGGIFVKVLSNISQDGTENYTWQAIDFKPAGSQVTDLNHVGAGLSTPGRFGVGIASTDTNVLNALSSELVVNKRNVTFQGTTSNVWEVELKDMSHSQYTPVAWIGHPIQLFTSNVLDASLYFATPSPSDVKYSNGSNANICFCPGKGSLTGLDASKPPALSVFCDGTVGVGTNITISELTVSGSISFTKGLLYYDAAKNESFDLGLWKLMQIPSSSSNITALQYYNSNAPNVGINTMPDTRYGVVMSSNVKIFGSLYSSDDSKLAQWYDGLDSATLTSNAIAPVTHGTTYTWSQVGLGVNAPKGDLDIKNNYGSKTTLRILCGDTTSNAAVHMSGYNGAWKTQMNDTTRCLDFGYDDSNVSQVDHTYPTRPLFMIWDSTRNCPQTYVGCTLDVLNTPVVSNIDKGASLIVDGGLSVIGDVTITGTYFASGQMVFNSNAATPPDLGSDDVYIGGGNIVVVPSSGNSVIIGHTNELTNQTNAPLLRVFQSADNTNSVVASFRTINNEGLMEISSGSTGNKLRFGVFDPASTTTNTCTFAFLDQNNSPYMSFYPAANGNYVGYNTFAPEAVMHVTATGSGSNMMRLTTRIVDQSSTSAAPELEFEKLFSAVDVAPTSWKLSGPNAACREKFSFSFGSNGMSDFEEIYCFTNDGCIGIGTSAPAYALDVYNANGVGALRLLNTGTTSNTCPQIVLQCETTTFGIGSNTDYRIYSSSNYFCIDSMQYNEIMPVMHVNDIGNIGFRSDASSNPNISVEIKGWLNVTDAILLNGVPLFSATGSLPSASLRASSVYLQPDANSGGGVHVNTDTSLVSGNLFYIASGSIDQNANMMVYDSMFPEAEIHLRTLSTDGSTNDMWRIGTAGTNFYLESWANCGSNDYVDYSHCNYTRALNIAPSAIDPGSGLFDVTIPGNIIIEGQNPTIVLGSLSSGPNINAHDSDMYIGGNTVHVVGCNDNSSAFQVGYGSMSIMDVTNIGVCIGSGYSLSGLNVATGQIFGLDGEVDLPTYTFASSSNTGIYNSSYGMSVTVGGILAGTFSPALLTVPQISVGGTLICPSTSSLSGLSIQLQDSSVVYPVVIDDNDVANVVASLVVTASNSSAIATFSSDIVANAVVFNGNGYVGIGTTIPVSPLTVAGSNATDTALSVLQSGTGMIAAFSGSGSNGVYINNVGYLGVGTSAPANPLHVEGQGYIDGNFICMSNMYVGIDLVVAGNTYTRKDQIVDSDQRLKSNLSNIDNALDRVSRLTGYTYTYGTDKKRSTGLIAQDVMGVLPEAVGNNPSSGMYGVEYGSMMGLIVEAIKELKRDVDDLKQKLI